MTKHKLKTTIDKQALQELLKNEEDFLKPLLIERVIQEVLEAEMNAALQADKGERSEQRLGYRSGYYTRSLITRVGKIELQVPQDRQGQLLHGSV